MDQRLRFGIFLAPFHAPGINPTLALQSDLELIQWLDRCGYDEAWCGEHHSAGTELSASPEIFIAVASERTRNIRLLYRGIRQGQSYFISLFLPRLGWRWQMTSQGARASLRGRHLPPHDGLRRMGGSIFGASLPMMVGRVCGHYELTSPVVPVRTPSCRSRTR
jgi:hypothetical protein